MIALKYWLMIQKRIGCVVGGMLIAFALIAASPLAAPLEFDAIRFFTGCTRGEGQLAVVLHGRQRVTVHGVGHVEPDGTLVLDQSVVRGAKAPKTRQWRLRQIAPHRYAGTLSDARGAVTGETVGDRLHLAFTGRDGFHVEQWLTLAQDGRSAANVLTAKRLGMTFGRLDEHIVQTERCTPIAPLPAS
jgi:hypothetical protein